MKKIFLVILMLSLYAQACSDDSSTETETDTDANTTENTEDTGYGEDSGVIEDSGVVDSGGGETDSGVPDSTVNDSGGGIADSGASDDTGGGETDSGITVDAGEEDTGDSALPEDTGGDEDSGGEEDSGDAATTDDSETPDDASSEEPYVKITDPQDGAGVENPVTFVIEYKNVSKVNIFADDYPLSTPWDPAVKNSLTYTFNGVGYERVIKLVGYSANDEELAQDVIKITVTNTTNLDKGELIGTMWNTYYYFASEADYSGADDTTLYDKNCNAIATVPSEYSDDVCVEGSGLLADGRVINYAATCSCGRPCPTGGTICYSVLDSNKYPWGMGSKGNALVPLRSWAVDNDVIPFGTVLYAEEWDGVEIPAVDNIGGFTHDGCFRADDIGGAIQNDHYDFFAGTSGMWLELEAIFPTRSKFTVYKNSPRCDYLNQ